MCTRSKNKCLELMSESFGPEHLDITGTKLPTGKQVLFCMLAHMQRLTKGSKKRGKEGKKLKWQAAKAVQKQISHHYNNANILSISDIKISEKVVKFHAEFQRTEWLPKRRKNRPPQINNILRDNFLKKLDETFQCWPNDAEEKMSQQKKSKSIIERAALEEDIKFLESMKTDRKASYVGVDKKYNEITERRMQRNKRVRQEDEMEKKIVPPSSELIEEEEELPEFTVAADPKRKHRRLIKSGTTIFIPHDILIRPDFVSTYVRNGISPTAAASMLQSLIDVCGGDPNAVNLSHNSAQRYSTENQTPVIYSMLYIFVIIKVIK